MAPNKLTSPEDRRLPTLSECLRPTPDQMALHKVKVFTLAQKLKADDASDEDLAYMTSLAGQTHRELDETWLYLVLNNKDLADGAGVSAAFLRNNLSQETALLALQQTFTTLGFGLSDGMRLMRAALYALTGQKDEQLAALLQDPGLGETARGHARSIWQDALLQQAAPTDRGAATQKANERRQKDLAEALANLELSAQQRKDVTALLEAAQAPQASTGLLPLVTHETKSKEGLPR